MGIPILVAWTAALSVHAAFPLPLPAGPAGMAAFHLLSEFNFEFLAGLLAAVLLRKRQWHPSAAVTLIIVGAALVLARLAAGGWGAEYGPPVARLIDGAGYGGVLLGMSALERSGRLPFAGAWGRIALIAGAMSYPLYLSHVPVIGRLSEGLVATGLAPALGANLVFALFLGTSLLVAAGLTAVFDKPIQALLAGRAPSLIRGNRLGPAARG
jgi:peptidoglycan/LPS O-acetylase OafA/YrhL